MSAKAETISAVQSLFCRGKFEKRWEIRLTYFWWFIAALERESRAVVDGQNLLENTSAMVMSGSDLPDYATAMSDPRFAKKPMYPVPPPPYAAVVNLPAEALTVEAVAAEVAAVPATETAPSTSASVTVDADPKL